MSFKIKLTNGAQELKRGTEFSTGLDLRARGFSKIIKNSEGKNIIDNPIWFDDTIKSIVIKPMERLLIKTGVHLDPEGRMELDDGSYYIIDTEVRNRSGLTLKEGILCQLGSIDEDFRADIGCSMINLSGEDYTINENDAVGQLIFGFACIPKIEYVTELSDSIRGIGGFGSTGK